MLMANLEKVGQQGWTQGWEPTSHAQHIGICSSVGQQGNDCTPKLSRGQGQVSWLEGQNGGVNSGLYGFAFSLAVGSRGKTISAWRMAAFRFLSSNIHYNTHPNFATGR
jgi:hypothetical protein